MSQRVALITDSTCDIPLELRKQYDIAVIPLTIIWGEQQFLDGVEISPDEFYTRLENDPIFPSTSQPSPG